MEHNIENIAEKWESYLDLLMNECGLGEILASTNRQYLNCLDWISDNFAFLKSRGLEVHHGATRLVIADTSHDYIVKIQIDRDSSIDYCAGEASVYAQAAENHLESRLAWCEKLLDYNYLGSEEILIPVYVMEYCEVDDDENQSASYDYQYILYCDENGLDEDDPDARDEFSDDERACDCGEEDHMKEFAEYIWHEDATALWDFLDDMNVTDLHSGNWGYANGRFVICDYAGYGIQVG